MTTTRSGRRGPYAGTAERRREIIAAALEAFARGGFRGSSLQEIGDAVGMSKAGLLHHFASKEELLLAVLEKREEIRQPSPDVRGLGILVHLRKAARQDYADWGTIALFVVTGAEATDPSHPAHDFFVNRYEAVVAQVSDAFAEAQRQGDLSESVNAVEAARLLISVMDGLLLQVLLNPRVDRLAMLDDYIEQFLVKNATRDLAEAFSQVFSEPPIARAGAELKTHEAQL